MLEDIRCGGCDRLLGKGEYVRLSIKCSRCKLFNNFSTASASNFERRRASNPTPTGQGLDHDDCSKNTLGTPP